MYNRYRRQRVLRAGLLMIISLFCVTALAQQVDEVDKPTGRESMFSLMKKGGPLMVPLGIGSILAVALAAERIISLRKEKVVPRGFMASLLEAWRRDSTGKAAIEYCDESWGPAAHVFKAGLQHLHKGEDALEKAIEDAGAKQADKLKRSLRGLQIIASVSPLLGLLGTVYGMIDAFQRATVAGMGKADVLSKGIYEALVTTATGLTIAIPTLLVYQFLSGRVDSIVDELDELGMEFMLSCTADEDGDEQ